jgi:hypothetical protein
VGFAGSFFELFLWALAVLVWRLTAVETWINFVALLAMAATGIKTLVNFNPLIKYDGYYLLSDFLGVPNLRRRAFGHVGRLLKRWFGWSEQPAPPATAREQRIYLIYGLIATVYAFSLMILVAIKTGAFLIDMHQPLGLAMLGFMLSRRLKLRVRRLMGKGRDEEDLPRSGVEDDLEEESTSVVTEDAPEEPARVAETAAARRTGSAPRTRAGGTWSAGRLVGIAGTDDAARWFARAALAPSHPAHCGDHPGPRRRHRPHGASSVGAGERASREKRRHSE